MVLAFFIMMIFAVGMFTSAIKDALTMTIPNWASVMVLGGFFLTVPFMWGAWGEVGSAWSIFGEHLLVGVSVFLFGFVIFAFGWLGGGDAKLMAATAFWWQWTDLLMYVTYTTLAGGVIAIFILWGRKYVPVKVLTADWLHRLVKDEKRMPYGLALAFGALVTLPQSEIFRAAVGLG